MEKRFLTLLAIVCFLFLAFSIFWPKEGKIFRFPIAPFRTDAEVKGIKEDRLRSQYKYSKLRNYPWDKDFKFVNQESYIDLAKELPGVRGKNTISVSLNDSAILYAKDEFESVPIASLTKIMTAVVALEHKKLEDKIKISRRAATVGENAMGISEGEIYTLEELLYGLILHSGNDAAYAIAEGTAGSAENFVSWMNLKVKELKLENTTYADPSGLNDGNKSSAYDLAKLTKYAMQNPDFKRIVGTIDRTIAGTEEHKYLELSNQTNLLRTYPGVRGVKTGYTEAANLCLVTYAENEGKEVIGVVLGSDARKTDMIQILDYSFGKIGVKIAHSLL